MHVRGPAVVQAPVVAPQHCSPQIALDYYVLFLKPMYAKIRMALCLVCHSHYTDQVVASVLPAHDTCKF